MLWKHSWSMPRAGAGLPPRTVCLCLFPQPIPSSPSNPRHPAPPEDSCPETGASEIPRGNPLALQLTCQSLGEVRYVFRRLCLCLLSLPPTSGWSLVLPDSISCLPHPRLSGRLPDGAPLGHICSLFGKQQLNSSAELTACSPRQFASCSAANASLAFQGDVNSAAFKG